MSETDTDIKELLNNKASSEDLIDAKKIIFDSIEAKDKKWIGNLIENKKSIVCLLKDTGDFVRGSCSCEDNWKLICKHQIALFWQIDKNTSGDQHSNESNCILIRPIEPFNLSNKIILKHASYELYQQYQHANTHKDVSIKKAFEGELTLSVLSDFRNFEDVHISAAKDSLAVTCSCDSDKNFLCLHQIKGLKKVIDFKLFQHLDELFRKTEISKTIRAYGFTKETYYQKFLEIHFAAGKIEVNPLVEGLFPLEDTELLFLQNELAQNEHLPISHIKAFDLVHTKKEMSLLVIFEKKGDLRIPVPYLQEINSDKITPLINVANFKKTSHSNLIDALDHFSINFHQVLKSKSGEFEKNQWYIEQMKVLLPLLEDYPVFNEEKLTVPDQNQLTFSNHSVQFSLSIEEEKPFKKILPELTIDSMSIPFDAVVKKANFILFNNIYYLLSSAHLNATIDHFKKHPKLLIHDNSFTDFCASTLHPLSRFYKVKYLFELRQQKSVPNSTEIHKIIYLSEVGNHILLTPAIRYGDREIELFSKQDLFDYSDGGEMKIFRRNAEIEIEFERILVSQHPNFQKLDNLFFLNLSKQDFIHEHWFYKAFEIWSDLSIEVLGFDQLSSVDISPHQMKVTSSIRSGLDWFETGIKVQFGKETIRLSTIRKAIKNRRNYVLLGSGKKGLLPEEWINKFRSIFKVSKLEDELLKLPKWEFDQLEAAFEEKQFSEEAFSEIQSLKTQLSNFESISPIECPKSLRTELRDYQQKGINWLNFLDDYRIGGCLADDMGLGKTIQVIAFLLHLKESKASSSPHLIVVPTSILFNWQNELQKFAPDLSVQIHHGSKRVKNGDDLRLYNVILTSYHTAMNDLSMLKKITFHYLILDESQAIKNPRSQRYMAVTSLQSQNRLALTGTPMENNTYDLYALFSFLNPSMFGTLRDFKQVYANPIDQFEDSKRATLLRNKIHPLMLRRTKQQVAKDLPTKTEKVLFCEMSEEQQLVYDTYKKEYQAFLAGKLQEDNLAKNTIHVLQGLTKLRQICNSPALLSDDADYGKSSIKIDVLLEQIKAHSPTHKLLIFSQFVGMLQLIKQQLLEENISFSYLDGQTKDRQQAVDNFQNNNDTRIFLISLKAGGTGLNLTAADYVYLVDPWWNPAVEAQAIDRSYRIGQTKNVFAYRLVCKNSIEEKILQLQSNKDTRTNELIHTDSDALKSLSKSDVLSLFS